LNPHTKNVSLSKHTVPTPTTETYQISLREEEEEEKKEKKKKRATRPSYSQVLPNCGILMST